MDLVTDGIVTCLLMLLQSLEPLQAPEEPGEMQLGRRPPESDVAGAGRSQPAHFADVVAT